MLTKRAIMQEKAQGGSLISLLVKLIDGVVIDVGGTNFSRQDFITEWPGGGKNAVESEWRDKANSKTGNFAPSENYDPGYVGDMDDQYIAEVRAGKHEWIPTNMVAYVIENAVIHNDAALAKKWLSLAEVLRTATRMVILKPTASNNVQGHVGAVYTQESATKYAPRFEGQGPFHDELRDILRTNLNPQRSSPETYRDELLAFINQRFWLGQALPGIKDTDPCPYYYLSGVKQYTKWGNTMGEMRQVLAQNWPTELKILQNSFTAFLSVPNSAVTYGHSALQLMQGVQFPGSAS